MIDYNINKIDEFLKINFEKNPKVSLALSKVNFVNGNEGSTKSFSIKIILIFLLKKILLKH